MTPRELRNTVWKTALFCTTLFAAGLEKSDSIEDHHLLSASMRQNLNLYVPFLAYYDIVFYQSSLFDATRWTRQTRGRLQAGVDQLLHSEEFASKDDLQHLRTKAVLATGEVLTAIPWFAQRNEQAMELAKPQVEAAERFVVAELHTVGKLRTALNGNSVLFLTLAKLAELRAEEFFGKTYGGGNCPQGVVEELLKRYSPVALKAALKLNLLGNPIGISC